MLRLYFNLEFDTEGIKKIEISEEIPEDMMSSTRLLPVTICGMSGDRAFYRGVKEFGSYETAFKKMIDEYERGEITCLSRNASE
jgi:hypothetical protein